MKQAIPQISDQIYKTDTLNVLENTYSIVGPHWMNHQIEWMNGVYSAFKDHEKFLKHEHIQNLNGLEIDMVYEWELGSMLIFDRTRLHCSSSKIEGKKIGLATFTKK